MHRQSTPEYQLDSEIERTFRRLLRENQGFAELGRMAAQVGGGDNEEGRVPNYQLVDPVPPNIIGIANDRALHIRDYAISIQKL